MWIDTWTGWAIFFVVVQLIHFLGTWKLYEKAGKKAWQAAVPVYNAVVLLEIIKRPKWWVIMLFLPIISPIFMMVLWVDTARCFGKRGLGDAFLCIVTFGFYLYYLNYIEKPDYIGPEDRKETIVSAVLFAVILATTVHTFFVQPMIIPTGSMENTLRIGDALFVSKNVYGTRIPNTPVAVPFSDLFSRNMFVEKLQLPYFRLPGWKNVEKNDIVVFNFPADSIYSPIDRKDNYVKRNVGSPGDVIEVKNGVLYVNDKEFQAKKDAKLQHAAVFKFKTPLSDKILTDEFGLVNTDYQGNKQNDVYLYKFHGITNEMFETLKNNPNTVESRWDVFPKGSEQYGIFPKSSGYNKDWYGPIKIPQKGETIDLTLDNLANYIDVIKKYEGNDLVVKDGQLLLNNQPAKQYTFKQDYYFMMGDNRDNSLDSRFFGFVPESHIIGQPFFLWANMNQVFGFEPKSGWHLDRFFTIPNNGNPEKTSWLWLFGIFLAVYFAWDFIKKRKSKKESK